jgi:hypothetical protein
MIKTEHIVYCDKCEDVINQGEEIVLITHGVMEYAVDFVMLQEKDIFQQHYHLICYDKLGQS